MWPHHQQAIGRVVQLFAGHDRYFAIIVGGSLGKGWASERSDVDVRLVVTDEKRVRRSPEGSLHFLNHNGCHSPDGYVDVKIVNRTFLEDVAARGSEPARAAFVGDCATYSRLPGLEDLLGQIRTYPEDERQRKIEPFYSYMIIYGWYVGQAEKWHLCYLATYAAPHLTLFSTRLILARNRVLFPNHKWLMQTLAQVADKLPTVLERIDDLLDATRARAKALVDCDVTFRDWGVPPSEAGAVRPSVPN